MPSKRKLPPRIDATPEEIAQAFLAAPPGVRKDAPAEYRCRNCGKEVEYPEVCSDAGRCEGCEANATA